jgi:O-antigen ligase
VTYRLVTTLDKTSRVLRILLFATSAVATYGVIQWLALQHGVKIELPGDVAHFSSTVFPIRRAYSTFVEPATFGVFLVSVLPITLILLASDTQRVATRGELALHGILQLAGLGVSFSVGQWFTFGALLPTLAVMVYLLNVSFRGRYVGLTLAVVCVLTLAGVAILTTGVAGPDRITQGFQVKLGNQDLSLGTRIQASQIALKMLWDSGLLGVGIGNFAFLYVAYERALGFHFDYGGVALLTPANLYVLLLAEIGIPGLLAALNVLVRLFVGVIGAIRSERRTQLGAILTALLGSLVAIGVSNNFVDNLFVVQYWILAALLMSMVRVADGVPSSLAPASQPALTASPITEARSGPPISGAKPARGGGR